MFRGISLANRSLRRRGAETLTLPSPSRERIEVKGPFRAREIQLLLAKEIRSGARINSRKKVTEGIEPSSAVILSFFASFFLCELLWTSVNSVNNSLTRNAIGRSISSSRIKCISTTHEDASGSTFSGPITLSPPSCSSCDRGSRQRHRTAAHSGKRPEVSGPP